MATILNVVGEGQRLENSEVPLTVRLSIFLFFFFVLDMARLIVIFITFNVHDTNFFNHLVNLVCLILSYVVCVHVVVYILNNWKNRK